MKLYNQTLELEALKAICEGDKKVSAPLLGAIDKSYFYTNVSQSAFERIKFIAKERTQILSWAELICDPTLSEDTREILSSFESQQKVTEGNYKGLISTLNQYRKCRIMHKVAEKIQQEVVKDQIDVDKIYQEMAEDILSAKSGKDISSCFTRIGDNSNTSERLKKILKGESLRFIPTGYKGWDDKNAGIPMGKTGIIAATSGGGKSLCANQLAVNMAKNDVKVCIVPLEMNADDMLQRFLANLTDLDMSKITKANELTKEERRNAYKVFKAFEEKIAKSGASIDLFNPAEDIEMEDLLFLLQPFDYNAVIIDYIGLLKGMEGERQWQKMGDAVRFAKRWGETHNIAVIILAQLSEEMVIRYSKTMKEHVDWMWSWNAGKLSDLDGSTNIIKVEPQKGRNQAQNSFFLATDYKKMSMRDATEEEIEHYNAKKGKGEFTPKNRENNSSSNKSPWKESNQAKTGMVDKALYDDL